MNFNNLKKTIIQDITDFLKTNYPKMCSEQTTALSTYIEDIFEKEYENVVLDIQFPKINSQYVRLKRTRQKKFISDYEKYLEGKLVPRMMGLFNTLPKLEQSEFIRIVDKWKESTETALLDFPYMDILTPTQKRALFDKEIAWRAGIQLNLLLENSQDVYEQVNPLIDTNLFSGGKINKITLSSQPTTTEDGSLSFEVTETSTKAKDTRPRSNYYVGAGFLSALQLQNTSGDISINTSLYESAIDTELLENFSNLVPDLHNQDYELFTEILQFRDYRFAGTRTIEVPMKTLAEITFPNTKIRKEHYETITNRLLKLVYYKQVEKEENGDIHIYGALSDLSIVTRGKERYAICTVSNIVIDAFQNNEITSIYSAELPRLKGSIAYQLVFFLQKERILAYQAACGNEVKIDYSRFLNSVRLVTRTKLQKIAELTEALKTIKEVGIILKDFHISGNLFHLTFYDLSPQEVKGYNISNFI